MRRRRDRAPRPQTTAQTLELLANVTRADADADAANFDAETRQRRPFFVAAGFRKPHLNWRFPLEYLAKVSQGSLWVAGRASRE